MRRTALPRALSVRVDGVGASLRATSRGVRIQHRELIKTYFGTNGLYVVDGFYLNPSNPLAFPWLYPIAQRYDKYRFRSVWLEWVPRLATTDRGQVVIGVDPDPNDPDPSFSALCNFSNSVTVSDWSSASLKVSPEVLGRNVDGLFTLAGDPPSADRHAYDTGCFFAGMFTTALTTQSIGQLFINYDVELWLPTLEDLNLTRAIDTYDGGNDMTNTWGTKVVESVGIMPALAGYDAGANKSYIQFTRPGRYHVDLRAFGTGLGDLAPAIDAGFGSIEREGQALFNAGTTSLRKFIDVNATVSGARVLFTPTVTTLTQLIAEIFPGLPLSGLD